MARFYGTVHGQAATPASRIGSRRSGLETTSNTWEKGVEVSIMADSNDEDRVQLMITTGSSPRGIQHYIGEVKTDEHGEPTLYVPKWAHKRIIFTD